MTEGDDLPPGWAWAELGDLASAEPRAITDGPFGSNLKSSHYVDEGPRVVRLQNIGFGDFVDEQAHISEQHFETLRNHAVEPGDLLVASLGQDLPRSCVAPAWLGPAIVKADCIRLRLHAEVDAGYVNLALQRPALKAAIADQVHGVGRPRLGLRGIRSMQVPMPSLAEQRRIVAATEEHLTRLDAGTAQVVGTERRLAALDRSVARTAAAGDVPWTTLGEVAEIKGGVTKDSRRQSDPAFVEVPYLRVANVQRGFLDLSKITYIKVDAKKAEALRLEQGDILFNEGGDRDKLGRGWVWEGQVDDCIHQNHVFRARLTDPAFDPYFVSMHGNTWGRAWFEEHGKQTTNLASLNLTTLRAFPVPAPPLAEQKAVVADRLRHAESTDRLRSAISSAQRRADALRRSILAAAFSGKLVPQDPDDEPASVLLDRIRAERNR